MAKPAGDDILFGRIALRNRFVTREQLSKAVRAQEQAPVYRRLGDIMLDLGIMTPEQVGLILRAQGKKLDKPDRRIRVPKRDALFGAVAVKLGFASQKQINRALRLQAQLRDKDRNIPLGKILVQTGVLTLSQVKTVLSHQRTTVMVCTGCGKRYNVVSAVPTRPVRCPKCDAELAAPEDIKKPDVDDVIEEELPPGAVTIGRYVIEKELSRGGMGVVYKARKRGTDEVVALKRMLAEKESLPQEVSRFERECAVISKLDHPNIVKVLDVCNVSGEHFFAMEFIVGRTLLQVLLDGRPSVEESVRIIRDVADALAYAHAQGVYHRDVKPANIMIEDETGRVVITDFGVAVCYEQTMRLTRTGFAVGTPTYMAPETAAGAGIRDYDPRSDVYSLGSVLFELLVGRPPFVADSPIDVLVRKINDPPPSPRSLNPEVPQSLDRIVLTALARECDARHESMAAFRDALDAFLTDLKRRREAAVCLRTIANWLAFSASAAAIACGLYAVTRALFFP